jgi:2-succinyl-6-hydroxy-2,4-cyclohexadiene-1-carboxylate synthase
VGSTFIHAVDSIAERALSPDAPAIVAGYSMGARVALHLALRHPDCVTAALLIGLHPGLADPGERRERAEWESSLAQSLRAEGIERFVERWERLPIFSTQSEEARAAQRATRLAHDPLRLASSLEQLGLSAMPGPAALLALERPIRLLVGGLDPKFEALAVRVRTQHPTLVTLRVVEGAGHNLLLEAPIVVSEEVERLAQAQGE